MGAIDRLLRRWGYVKLDDYGLLLTSEDRVLAQRPKILDDGTGGRLVGWKSNDLAASELEPWWPGVASKPRDLTFPVSLGYARSAPVTTAPQAPAPNPLLAELQPEQVPAPQPVSVPAPAAAPAVAAPAVAARARKPATLPPPPVTAIGMAVAPPRPAPVVTPAPAPEPAAEQPEEEDWEWEIAVARARAEAQPAAGPEARPVAAPEERPVGRKLPPMLEPRPVARTVPPRPAPGAPRQFPRATDPPVTTPTYSQRATTLPLTGSNTGGLPSVRQVAAKTR